MSAGDSDTLTMECNGDCNVKYIGAKSDSGKLDVFGSDAHIWFSDGEILTAGSLLCKGFGFGSSRVTCLNATQAKTNPFYFLVISPPAGPTNKKVAFLYNVSNVKECDCNPDPSAVHSNKCDLHRQCQCKPPFSGKDCKKFQGKLNFEMPSPDGYKFFDVIEKKCSCGLNVPKIATLHS